MYSTRRLEYYKPINGITSKPACSLQQSITSLDEFCKQERTRIKYEILKECQYVGSSCLLLLTGRDAPTKLESLVHN